MFTGLFVRVSPITAAGLLVRSRVERRHPRLVAAEILEAAMTRRSAIDPDDRDRIAILTCPDHAQKGDR